MNMIADTRAITWRACGIREHPYASIFGDGSMTLLWLDGMIRTNMRPPAFGRSAFCFVLVEHRLSRNEKFMSSGKEIA
jgi:hypothetical protein